jgi:serine/threonine protein kinase/tetratricopeptide (TPR) repeat protein
VPKCPTLDDLDQFHRGLLDSDSASGIREHLSGCASCSQVYREHSLALVRSGPATASFAPELDQPRAPRPRKPRHVPTIEGYRILGVLGQGGMGVVYRALQAKLNRTVALKVLPAVLGAANPQLVARFRREATAAARLHHTNIIPIYDFGESKDAYYYAMELINGQPLNALVESMAKMNASLASPPKLAELLRTASEATVVCLGESSPVTVEMAVPAGGTGVQPALAGSPVSNPQTRGPRHRSYFYEIAGWIADAADALHYAHTEGIIHRDIKPANLILSTDKRIMIADFGLAKSSEDASVTMTGSFIGTLRYVSPEQAQARRVPVDHRTDIYSLGATFYELLTFQPAYPGTDDKEILGAILSRDPRPPRKLVPAVPHELDTICMKMMEKQPATRYATAREAAEDLRRFLTDLPIVARRPSLLARGRKFVRRHRAAVAVAISVVLVLLTGLVSIQANRMRIQANRQKLAAQVDGLVEEALRWQAFKKYDDASKRLEKALSFDPNNFRALSNLAVVRRDQYNASADPDPALLEEANGLCDRALAISESPTLWNIKGIVLKILKRYDEAIQAYEGALALDPNSVPWLANLGVVYALKEDFARAEETFLRATELAGTATDCNANPWRHLGALRLYRLLPDALQAIDQAQRCQPADAWAAVLRVRYFLEIPATLDADEAVIDARVADRLLLGTDPKAKQLLALAYFRNGQDDRALEEAAAAEALDSQSVVVALIQAAVAARQGRGDEAQKALDRADAVWPQDLQSAGEVRVTAESGVLWIERAEPLLELRSETVRLARSGPERPPGS